MPDDVRDLAGAPDKVWGDAYDKLRIGREHDRIQADKYRQLAEQCDDEWKKERLMDWARIHQNSVDQYTTILKERGLE